MKKNRERPQNRVWNVPISLRDTAYVWVSDEYRGYGSKRRFRKLDTVVDSFLRGYRVNGFTGTFKMRVHWLAGPEKNMVQTLVITCDGRRAYPPPHFP
jgi:hypothetical protein